MSWLLRDEVLEPVQAYAALCREAGYTPASVALAWVLRNENVSSAIVGASRPEQIAENVKALDVVLEPDFVEAIEKVLEPDHAVRPRLHPQPAPPGPDASAGRAQLGASKREVKERSGQRRVGAVLLEDPGIAGVGDAPALVGHGGSGRRRTRCRRFRGRPPAR